MQNEKPFFKDPLRYIGWDAEDALPDGGFGAILSKPGVGKTALLVQLALYSMLQGKNVLHISLNDPVDKVCLWYEEVFRHISINNNLKRPNAIWEQLLPNRFIMTFKVESFDVPKLEERMTDLIEQKIFHPDLILVDRLPFDKDISKLLSDFKALVKNHPLKAWFTIRLYGDEPVSDNGVPLHLMPVADLFDNVIKLEPVDKEIHVKILKGKTASDFSQLLFDPSTMMIVTK